MEKRGNKGRVVAIILLVILLLVVGVLVFYNMNGEKRAKTRLTQISKIFYKYYYEDNSDKNDKDAIKVFLSKYAASGLTIRLKDMKVYIDSKKVENYKALKKCDEEKTKVIIYPQTPYGKDDFKIETKLDCK
ncbi:MAG: hypothetical protein IJ094_11955 [Bacilli bacterium]|nr:hypothetical protein [Bacilli bacterium]